MCKTILTLWPNWSYSSKATKLIQTKMNYSNYSIEYLPTINDVVNNVKQDVVWVIPISNVYWWTVNDSFSSIYENRDKLKLIHNTKIPINHCIASNWRWFIDTVYSHPQAIMQTKKALNWRYKTIDTTSTTAMIWKLVDNEWVICDRDEALNRWLTIVEDNLVQENETEFILLWDRSIEYDISTDISLLILSLSKIISWNLADSLLIFKESWLLINFILSIADWNKWFDFILSLNKNLDENFLNMYRNEERKILKI